MIRRFQEVGVEDRVQSLPSLVVVVANREVGLGTGFDDYCCCCYNHRFGALAADYHSEIDLNS